ncbi:hypothetical protein ILYODFUR_028971 [Ilyodon furcidens]|uniref:Uncharacterized protein n=1 Tax=Ilyodon furcidens TaxID=33524 RepID=A0ABV0TMX1_9TELE
MARMKTMWSNHQLDRFPELLRDRLVVLLNVLTEILPGLSFSLCYHLGHGMLGLTVPVSCLRSLTSQPELIRHIFQLDGIPYGRCPPPGLGNATATGTADLKTTAMCSSINNRGGKPGPLGLCLQPPLESVGGRS